MSVLQWVGITICKQHKTRRGGEFWRLRLAGAARIQPNPRHGAEAASPGRFQLDCRA